MTDINTQIPDDETLSSMTRDELRAVQQSWLREKEKAVKEVRMCEDVLVKVHMKLNRKGEFTKQHQEILKTMQGDSNE